MEYGDGAGVWPQRGELRAWLADDAGVVNVYPLRLDHGMAVAASEPADTQDTDRAPLLSRARVAAALAGVLGVVVGLLLSVLLAHTAFAPGNRCGTDAHGASTCARAAP